MKYSYKFKLNQKDMWKYYMIDRYSSLAGIVQIIFIVSLIILVCTKWDTLGPIEKIVKEMVPFYIFMVIALMLIAFVPEVSLFLPNLLK